VTILTLQQAQNGMLINCMIGKSYLHPVFINSSYPSPINYRNNEQ